MIYPRATGTRGLAGANVLLVVEIADSSLRYDIGRKAALYASFGIRELWVIDACTDDAGLPRAGSDGYRDARDFGSSTDCSASPRGVRAAARRIGLE